MSTFNFDSEITRISQILWGLLHRIGELEEFNSQWEEIFKTTKLLTGTDNKVRIDQVLLYQTFMSDKFHIIVSDLHSLLSGLIIDQQTILKSTISELKVYPVEHYKKDEDKIQVIDLGFFDIGGEHRSRTSEETEEFLKSARDDQAERKRNFMISAMKELFPKINSEYVIAAADIEDLKAKVKSLEKLIEPIRHIYNHKHQQVIVNKYLKRDDLADLEKVKTTLLDFMNLFNNISLVYKDTTFSDSVRDNLTDYIEGMIDIILFGSSERALNKYLECAPPDKQDYAQARRYFYESDKIQTIVII